MGGSPTGRAPSKLGGKRYSVVLDNCAARLLTFGKFSYLYVLIRYLHDYSIPGSAFVCLFELFIFFVAEVLSETFFLSVEDKFFCFST